MTKPEPGTSVLTDTSDRNLAVVLVVIGVIVGVVAVIVAIRSDNSTAGLIVGAIAVVLLAVGVWVVRKTAAWHNPELFLPTSDGLRLGSESIARFRRRARRAGSAHDATVRAVLTCVESATYQVGSTSSTVTATVVEAEQAITAYPDDDVLEVDITIAVGLFDGPPTMDLGNNEVRWTLEVEIDAPNAPDDKSSFPIEVVPEVVT